jgi:hypothetical protein
MRSSFVKSLLSSGSALPLLVGAAIAMSNPAKAESPEAPETFMRGGHEYNIPKSTFDGEPALQKFIKIEKDQYRFYPDPKDNPGKFYAPKDWPMKDGEIVKDLRVEGTELLEEGFAKRYIMGEDHAKRTRPGEPFDKDLFVLAVTSLFATGMYWEIIVSKEDDTLVVNAIESPVVRGEVVGREDLMSAEEKAALEASNKLDMKEANALYEAIRFNMIETWEKSKNDIVSEYSDWKRYNIVPFQTDKFSGDEYINLYANDKVDSWGNFNQMPIGTILVIDSFRGDADRSGFAARWKTGDVVIFQKMKRGFNAATGDWKVTKIDSKGNAQDITKEKGVKSAYLFSVPDKYKKSLYF